MTAHKTKHHIALPDRSCLGPCGEMFTPAHEGNRVCPKCTKHNNNLSKQEAMVTTSPRWRRKGGKNE